MRVEEVVGWINAKRRLGGIIFLEIIPGTSLKPLTIVVKRRDNEELWKAAKSLKLGSAIKVRGERVKEGMSRRGEEFKATKLLEAGSPLEPLPVDPLLKTNVSLDTSIKYRYVMLRNPKIRAIFRLRSLLLRTAREYLEEEGFLEVNTPKLCGAGAEGGAELFELNYFGRRAYLAQSPQLYKQMLMAGIPKVYEITPYFRAEKHHTVRHLNESWGIDIEMGFISGMNDVMNLLEGLVAYIIEGLRSKGKEELRSLGIELEVPPTPFRRVTYDEALKLLKDEGVTLKWGEDLSHEAERKLGEIMSERGYQVYFITGYPWEAKPFYIMRAKGGLSMSFDLDYSGLEVASGGQREHRLDELIRNMREKGLDLKEFEFYLEAFKYGIPPHGGFGLGVERLLMSLLKLNNVREAILFPRDIQRLIP